jgi:hypothetical protein
MASFETIFLLYDRKTIFGIFFIHSMTLLDRTWSKKSNRVGCFRAIRKVPPRQLAPACYYDDVRNGTANHGQGAGNSKRGPIFDRQSSAAKLLIRINLRGINVHIQELYGNILFFNFVVFYFLSGNDI